jgi:hypothetical protein
MHEYEIFPVDLCEYGTWFSHKERTLADVYMMLWRISGFKGTT